jgi:CBS domain containing-hemolysin-like protein
MVLDGLTRLAELRELTGLKPDEELDVDTLGGLVMASLDRVPRGGDEVVVGGRTLRVERMDGRRVASVRVLPAPTHKSATREDGEDD